MADNAEPKTESIHEEKGEVRQDENLDKTTLLQDAFAGENHEHEMGAWEAAKTHPWACFWAFLMCFTIVMESFDMFLNTNFIALTYFKKRFGHDDTIATKWTSALFQSGQSGAFVGVFLAGPITSWIGYRWTTILGLILINCTIFIMFFATSLEVMVIGQTFEGVSWGFFIANAPAYASEVVPLAVRGACTATLQMSWSIGSIIVAGVAMVYNYKDNQWSWRLPTALQWMFPTPLMILIFFAPESPWWLVRRGRREEALRSIKRLGDPNEEAAQTRLAMIERTVEIEALEGGTPNLLDLFKGTDLRRTIIICLMYASQNLAGNLIANQATFFFEQAGISTTMAFKLNLITTCLQFVANAVAWPVSSIWGRRSIYLYGLAFNITMLFTLGIIASVPQTTGTNYGQAVLGIIISVWFAGTQGPISYTIIAETSSIRLRALSTAVGRAAYYLVEIPMIYLSDKMLNTSGWDLAGKCGYVWGGTALFCWVVAYFWLPELKGRSYREIDILFKRKTPARKFIKTEIRLEDNE